jgi:hypothetical protein
MQPTDCGHTATNYNNNSYHIIISIVHIINNNYCYY